MRSFHYLARSAEVIMKHKRPRLALLHQAIPPPLINGVTKPPKPGGYQDSGADIAFNLQRTGAVEIVSPLADPDPRNHEGWCFPDTEEGILSAIRNGATHLWANTILFRNHPIQSSKLLDEFKKHVHVVGQPPLVVDAFDDKDYTNNLLRKDGNFTMPKSWSFHASTNWKEDVLHSDLSFPVVAKPIRGRGSHGVKKCNSQGDLAEHLELLSQESTNVMVEEYLAGEEATLTIMPPSERIPRYWALPIVTRFNHDDGIAPYNGVVAVTANSRVISEDDAQRDERYDQISRECEAVAKLLRVTAPIRIDARRFCQHAESPFALFDINMKPNMTGPGRPGREDQASLTVMAAAALGWDYARFLKEMLTCSRPLDELRCVTPPTLS